MCWWQARQFSTPRKAWLALSPSSYQAPWPDKYRKYHLPRRSPALRRGVRDPGFGIRKGLVQMFSRESRKPNPKPRAPSEAGTSPDTVSSAPIRPLTGGNDRMAPRPGTPRTKLRAQPPRGGWPERGHTFGGLSQPCNYKLLYIRRSRSVRRSPAPGAWPGRRSDPSAGVPAGTLKYRGMHSCCPEVFRPTRRCVGPKPQNGCGPRCERLP